MYIYRHVGGLAGFPYCSVSTELTNDRSCIFRLQIIQLCEDVWTYSNKKPCPVALT